MKRKLMMALIAYSTSFSTLIVMSAFAILNRGALIYYYEPNPLVLLAEIALFSYTMLWLVADFYKRREEWVK